MIVYHFAFDLMLFGMVDWPVDRSPEWRAFAASIASSFLFLSGVSIAYAHGRPVGVATGGVIRWPAFVRRLGILCAAAAAVTAGTMVAMPAPIFFGILHAIALFSLLALPFRNAPPLLTALVALAIFVLPAVWRSEVFAAPWFYPVGLAPVPPFTMDYEPIFPWLGAFLLGVAAGRILPRGGSAASPALGPLARMGRWSLPIYLVHQPVLFALLYAVSAF